MAARLKRAGRRSRDRPRRQVVEPVFGPIQQARSVRQFLLRGFAQVRGEWAMISSARNLLTLAKATCSAWPTGIPDPDLNPEAPTPHADGLLGGRAALLGFWFGTRLATARCGALLGPAGCDPSPNKPRSDIR